MTDTNRLLKLQSSDLAGADLLRLWSQKYGGDAALSLSNLTTFLQESLTFPTAKTAQYEAPNATGFSVTIGQANSWLILTPSAGYADGTIVLPTATQGDEVLVVCSQSVASLTITPATGDSVVGHPSALSANQSFLLKYDSVLKRWYTVG